MELAQSCNLSGMVPNSKALTIHVYRPDTVYEATTESPRGEALFGTLVVCLPSAHTGGQLRVRHGSATANFDWAKRSGDSIPWVALYSGCELEMAKITSDYRITLTYHLFADVGRQSPLAAAADWSALPLCRALRSALGRATFLPEGGVLGFRCQFRYPHTSNQFAQRPASLLKGADAVLFAAMRQLGLRIRFAHVYKVWKSVEGKRRGMEEEDDDEISDEVKRMDNIKRRLVRARLEAEAAAAAISDVLTALMRAEPEDENGIDPDDILLPSQSVADRIGTAVTQRSEEPVRYRAQTEIVAPLCAWEYQENEGSLAGSGTWEDSFPFCFPVLRNGADVKWAVKGPTYWEAGKLSVEGTGWYRAASEAIYCAAAILVTVPGWGSEQRSDLIEESAASGSHAE
ncbi:hypothetical protein KFL_006780070 [Klebsormidium nitens]|uniref:Uncharacterized protein n=1 Tax=Klebsormidium nitens TaxID=105231 RepID=A0A1Y1IPR4_KLENI|nr:hypothetical protein KFL_006780070 [Klebsormidium nitens]|eukprot:GAQ90736.1 hypothetical protein KFL_006780070 [Klebsormidium nitens]